jgi:hypothetical protein
MKTIQIESGIKYVNSNNDDLLRVAGVKRIFPGWYTVQYRGVIPDYSTVVCAWRNRGGKIKMHSSFQTK